LLLGILCIFSVKVWANWQTNEQGCFIEINLAEAAIKQQQSLHLRAVFRCPEAYQLDEDALIDHLLWHANLLAPQWVITSKAWSSLKPNEKGEQQQSLTLELYPLAAGTLFLSLLNVPFTAHTGTPINIVTPVFEIKVAESPLKNVEPLAPLLALEPEFPLYLSSQNRQLQLDPSKLAMEKKRNQRILNTHAFPWPFLLLLLGLGLAGMVGIKWRQHQHLKQREEVQMRTLKQRTKELLQHLKRGKEWQNALWRDVYLNLSDICLEYLSERFQRKTSFFSTAELELIFAQFDTLGTRLKNELTAFLTHAYYVKFANDQPTGEDCQKAIRLIEELIE